MREDATTPFDEGFDEDLAWVEREIAKCEDGPRLAPRTPENLKAMVDRLERLYAMRKRLMRDDAA